jgi:hypothetical protein
MGVSSLIFSLPYFSRRKLGTLFLNIPLVILVPFHACGHLMLVSLLLVARSAARSNLSHGAGRLHAEALLVLA